MSKSESKIIVVSVSSTQTSTSTPTSTSTITPTLTPTSSSSVTSTPTSIPTKSKTLTPSSIKTITQSTTIESISKTPSSFAFESILMSLSPTISLINSISNSQSASFSILAETFSNSVSTLNFNNIVPPVPIAHSQSPTVTKTQALPNNSISSQTNQISCTDCETKFFNITSNEIILDSDIPLRSNDEILTTISLPSSNNDSINNLQISLISSDTTQLVQLENREVVQLGDIIVDVNIFDEFGNEVKFFSDPLTICIKLDDANEEVCTHFAYLSLLLFIFFLKGLLFRIF